MTLTAPTLSRKNIIVKIKNQRKNFKTCLSFLLLRPLPLVERFN